MSNIIDSIKLSGVTYTIQGSGGGGNPTVELTQAEYDVLVTAGTVQADTYYIITDAQGGDLTNYYTKTETNTLLNGKQATLVSGTNIKTINNESLLGSGNIDIQGGGGGGKAVTGGTNISVTTGETADTINCTLPITASNDNRCIITGTEGTKGNAEGMGTYESFITGRQNNATNYAEAAFGRYNFSNHKSNTFGDSGNTLFSVGNGTGVIGRARHNAFEIRQNGDIYLTKDGQDVKLQDQLGGGSITVDTALDSGSTNPVENRVIYNKIDEVEQVTAAGLNAVNEKFGGLKLQQISQSDYNNLQTKDPSTLYIVTDS